MNGLLPIVRPVAASNAVAAGNQVIFDLPVGPFRYRQLILEITGTTGDPARAGRPTDLFNNQIGEIQLLINSKTQRTYNWQALVAEMLMRGRGPSQVAAYGDVNPQSVLVIDLQEDENTLGVLTPQIIAAGGGQGGFSTIPTVGQGLAWGTAGIQSFQLAVRVNALPAGLGLVVSAVYDPFEEALGAIRMVRANSVAIGANGDQIPLLVPGGRFSLLATTLHLGGNAGIIRLAVGSTNYLDDVPTRTLRALPLLSEPRAKVPSIPAIYNNGTTAIEFVPHCPAWLSGDISDALPLQLINGQPRRDVFYQITNSTANAYTGIGFFHTFGEADL